MDGSQGGALSQGSVAIGFAFVDAAVGKFYVGTINDDCSRGALESLLAQVLIRCTCRVVCLYINFILHGRSIAISTSDSMCHFSSFHGMLLLL